MQLLSKECSKANQTNFKLNLKTVAVLQGKFKGKSNQFQQMYAWSSTTNLYKL